MSHQLKAFVKKRGIIKGKLTRLINSLRDMEHPEVSILEVRKAKLEEIAKEFSNAQLEIELLDKTGEQVLEAADFEEHYYESVRIL